MKKKLKKLLAASSAALYLCMAMTAFAETATPAPSVDPTQRRYSDETIATPTPQPGQTETTPFFSLYCIGNAFFALQGDSLVACDVRNKPASTHDILMRWYITESELTAHGLSTEGLLAAEEGQEACWVIVETGLFEPGYAITSVQLLPLPDGSFLPPGVYCLVFSECFFDHVTGVQFPYEAKIPITLTIGEQEPQEQTKPSSSQE